MLDIPVLVVAVVIAAVVATGVILVNRRRHADTGLVEWRRAARGMSMSQRRAVGRAVRTGQVAPHELSAAAVQLGHVQVALTDKMLHNTYWRVRLILGAIIPPPWSSC